MTYRNDPYDPKQVALLDQTALDDAVAQAEKAFADAADVDALVALKYLHLGDRAPIALARREIGALPPQAKSDAGKRVNAARAVIQSTYDARLSELESDRAAPGPGRGVGGRHAAVEPPSARRPASTHDADGADRGSVHRHGIRDRRGA